MPLKKACNRTIGIMYVHWIVPIAVTYNDLLQGAFLRLWLRSKLLGICNANLFSFLQ